MKKNDITILVCLAAITAVFSFVLVNLIFAPSKHSVGIPQVNPLPASLPDIKNDTSYKSFLNDQAIDPTRPVKIGGSQNSTPFNASQ